MSIIILLVPTRQRLNTAYPVSFDGVGDAPLD